MSINRLNPYVLPAVSIAIAVALSSSLAAQHPAGASHGGATGALVKTVRDATERFKDVAVAEAEGYQLLFGCVSGPDSGAMGLHYVNLPLVADNILDPARPEIVIYEPLPNGRVKLIGADFLVFADNWHATNQATPQLGGQLLHLFESPNRFGLPTFYTLHVWAWKDNPSGTFSNWHSNVSCDSFSPTGQIGRNVYSDGGIEQEAGSPARRIIGRADPDA